MKLNKFSKKVIQKGIPLNSYKLFDHQLAAVKYLQVIENEKIDICRDLSLCFNSAFVKLQVGSGKTLIVLEFMLQRNKKKTKSVVSKNLIGYDTHSENLNNLIIVPPGLFDQWKRVIEKCRLECQFIYSSKDIATFNFSKRISLLNSNYINEFFNHFEKQIFDMVVVDECQDIKHDYFSIPCQFILLVSATLFEKNPYNFARSLKVISKVMCPEPDYIHDILNKFYDFNSYDLLFSNNYIYKSFESTTDSKNIKVIEEENLKEIILSENKKITFEKVNPFQATNLFLKDGILNKKNDIYDFNRWAHVYDFISYKNVLYERFSDWPANPLSKIEIDDQYLLDSMFKFLPKPICIYNEMKCFSVIRTFLKKILEDDLATENMLIQYKMANLEFFKEKILELQNKLESSRDPILYDKIKLNIEAINNFIKNYYCSYCGNRVFDIEKFQVYECNHYFCATCKNSDSCKRCSSMKIKSSNDHLQFENPVVNSIQKILDSNSSARILLVSFIDCSGFSIKDELKNKLLNLCKLRGINFGSIIKTCSGKLIDKTIKSFENGEFSVLYLNTFINGSGFNLNFVTDIIFPEQMSLDAFKQAFGRAQRMPRSSQLNVHIFHKSNKEFFDLICH